MKVYTLFYCILTRLQESVNLTSRCTGKPQLSFDSLYLDVYCGGLEWNPQYLGDRLAYPCEWQASGLS